MRNKDNRNIGVGVGYVSVMLIFAVISLTIFAVLSFKSAMSSDSFNERSGEFLQQYYAADTAAKEKLSQLHNCALKAKESVVFEDAFEELAEDVGGVKLRRSLNGYVVSYSIPINERQELAVKINFDENGKYTIEQWRSDAVNEDTTSDSHLNVWDGTF